MKKKLNKDIVYSLVEAKCFIEARNHIKKYYLFPYTEEEYKEKGVKLFLSQDKKSGFGIAEDGELLSLFSLEKGRGDGLVESAKKHNITYLRCLGDKLKELYLKHGFEIIKKKEWDDKTSPRGWDYEKFGRPVYYKMILKNKIMKKEINTKPLSGFMELKPAEQILFNKIKDVIEKNYRLFGFIPMDNPLIERKETLFANVGGETQKEIYQFKKGDEEIALRFDLTVPLARYVADKYGELTFPFKRYQIAKVYRGERPQAGRFREFYQADIDVIGDGELSLNYDSEVIAAAIKIFQDLDLDATIRINNRKIFNGIFDFFEIDENKRDEFLIFIDKWEKIGEEKVKEEILKLGIEKEKLDKILEILKIKKLEDLEKTEISTESFQDGLKELKEVFENLKAFGFDEKKYELDLIIVRGLAYYTGTIYETRLNQNPEFGSVCSGGRYENLASAYTDKKLPGVGISIGLSRLFDLLLKNQIIQPEEKTYTKFLILPMTDDKKTALKLAQKLREENIPTEINFDFQKKLGKRIRYADKLGIPFVVLIGEDEIREGFYTVKNLETGEQERVEKIEDLIKKIKNTA